MQKLSSISKQVTLKSIVEARSGGTPSRTNPDYWGDYLPWVTAKDLKTFYLEDSLEKISFKAVKKGVPLAKNNEVLILVRGMGLMKDVPIGVAKCQMSFGQDIKVLVPKEGIDGEYLAHFLVAARPQLMDMVTLSGHGTGRIETEKLLSLKVWLPTLQVQKRIIDSLTIWNNAIALTEKLITAKRRLKQGITQNLITGKLQFQEFAKSKLKQKIQIGRIPTNWRIAKIGEIAREVSERLAPENTTVLSCTKYDGLVPSLEYFGRQVFGENLDNYKIVKRDQFAYATNHIEEGSIGLLRDFEAGLVSPMYTVFRVDTDIVEPEFLYSVLKTETYRRLFESLTSASVNRRGSLRWNGFSKIVVPLPTILEQKKIVSVLKMADSEIKLLSTKLELLKTQKRGLMQQLLTGKIRIQTP